jgi:glycosyltransferase involved in cell wall biosynthesis
LSRGLVKHKDIKIFIICGGGNGLERFDDLDVKIMMNKNFLHTRRSYISFLSAVVTLKKFIRDQRIDIIHSHSHYAANIAFKSAKGSGINTIQTNHGILENRGKLNHFSAHKYIAVNEHIYNYIIEKKISNIKNTHLIRCGIHVPDIPSVKKLNPIRVLAASRFNKNKGLDVYIKAVSEIKSVSRKNVEFLLAGEGEMEEELRNLNKKLNAGIKFLGRVDEIEKLLDSTHILVFPSKSDTEGFPVIIMEGGACNNLLITTDFNGVHPIIKNNENGLIFHKDDEIELKSILEKTCLDYENFNPLSLNLYKDIKHNFQIEKTIKEHIELYSECLRS